MSFNITPSQDPGLWSVLQGGLTLLAGDEMEQARRELVLDCLVSMFDKAERGSQAVSGMNVFRASQDPAALTQFSFFSDYLSKPLGNDLSTRLNETLVLFRRLRAGEVADANDRQKASEILEGLLSGLNRDQKTAPLVAPKIFSY